MHYFYVGVQVYATVKVKAVSSDAAYEMVENPAFKIPSKAMTGERLVQSVSRVRR